MQTTAPPVALAVQGVTRVFGPTRALDGVDLSFTQGRVTAVVGANGSGKSTLLKILSGLLDPTDGTVTGFGGRPIRSIRQAQELGVVLVPQEPTLAGHLTVWQNVSLVSPEARRGWFLRDRSAQEFAVRHLEGLLPLEVASRPTSSLNKSSRQLVQLAAAMARDPKVLLLDEPTAVLDEDGVIALHALVHRFVERGGTVLIVSHRLRDILALAEDVVVLRSGRVELAEPVDADTERTIVALLSAEDRSGRPAHRPDERHVVLEARDIVGWRGLDVAELRIHAGEIVGIAGQSGSGRSRLASVLAGAHSAAGTITVGSTAVRAGSIRSARAAGVSYIPEDRHATAIMGNQTMQHNLILGQHRRSLRRGPFRRRTAERDVARSMIDAFDIRPPLPSRHAGLLSGGNQQKVVVARALSGSPVVVIADEPTQGVDARARAALHTALAKAAADGTAVVAVCSEFEELFEIADRIVVVCDGRIVLDQPRDRTTPDEVLAASLGARSVEELPEALTHPETREATS